MELDQASTEQIGSQVAEAVADHLQTLDPQGRVTVVIQRIVVNVAQGGGTRAGCTVIEQQGRERSR